MTEGNPFLLVNLGWLSPTNPPRYDLLLQDDFDLNHIGIDNIVLDHISLNNINRDQTVPDHVSQDHTDYI